MASNYTQDPAISNSSKRTIEQWATEFGTKVLLDKIWKEGAEAKIESDKLVLPFRDWLREGQSEYDSRKGIGRRQDACNIV